MRSDTTSLRRRDLAAFLGIGALVPAFAGGQNTSA
jgi:hypothetical protein